MASPSVNVQETQDSDDPSDFYDILMLGRTGFGKSTTANKLLVVDEATIRPWSTDVSKFFDIGKGIESETKDCKLLSNEHNVRVLDTPGFADTRLTKEHGVMRANLQIFRWILQEQDKYNLAFCRVLYFLPHRGPPEKAEGTLQEEIQVMYEFLGEDVFNIMVIIATNRKKHQMYEFDEEDMETTSDVFTLAYEEVSGNRLPKCPPILYLPIAETDVINKVVAAQVIADNPLEKPEVIDVIDRNQIVTLIGNNPGRRLHFQDRCTRCTGKIIYVASEKGRHAIKIVYEDEEEVPIQKSKCHPIFIPKHYVITKIIGGVAHIATLGVFAVAGWYRGKPIWPGFTNSNEICPVCGMSPGSKGCSDVGQSVNTGKNVSMVTSHLTSLDEIQKVG